MRQCHHDINCGNERSNTELAACRSGQNLPATHVFLNESINMRILQNGLITILQKMILLYHTQLIEQNMKQREGKTNTNLSSRSSPIVFKFPAKVIFGLF